MNRKVVNIQLPPTGQDSAAVDSCATVPDEQRSPVEQTQPRSWLTRNDFGL
jgi:hypothetical protein